MASMSLTGQSETSTERVLLSRQPIYDAELRVVAYELLFRDNESDRARFVDGLKATAQVIVQGLMEIGMDDMVGKHRAFINFERKLLTGKYYEALPADRVVLEILESVKPDPDVLKILAKIRQQGYLIALDDFVCSEEYFPLLPFANYVKLDMLANDWDEIDRVIPIIRQYPIELVAEKVETREQMERCKERGFKYFQGYFFCRPQNVSGKPLPANRLSMLRLLTQMNKPDIRIQELEQTISQDASLSYKLLRYINSAMCSLDRQVSSIRHATIMVGLQKMRVWASLIVFSGFGEASQELIVVGAIRARMSELLAIHLRMPFPERYFLVGLFSILDAILDRPMEMVLSMLSLSSEVTAALLHHEGDLGTVLRCVQAFERREWFEAQETVQVDQECLEKIYAEALTWSNGLVGLARRSSTSV